MFKEFVVDNILYRIAPDPDQYAGGHEKPFWFYFPKLFNQIGPWLITLPAAYAWVFRDKMPQNSNCSGLRFISIIFPLGVVLLSIPGTKREVYLMPLLAPLAVHIATWATATRQESPSRISRVTTNLVGTVSAILPALIALIIRVLALLLAPLGLLRPPRLASLPVFLRTGRLPFSLSPTHGAQRHGPSRPLLGLSSRSC